VNIPEITSPSNSNHFADGTTLKAELVWRTVLQSRAQADVSIGRYIDGFCDPVRRHSAIDFVSPIEFENAIA
jgi:putative transposase